MLPFKRSSESPFERWYFTTDKTLLVLALLLIVLGLLLNLASSPYVAMRLGLPPMYFFYRQLLFAFGASVLMVSISFLNVEQIKSLGKWLFIGSLVAIAFVLCSQHAVKGAKRWIHLFGFSIQPSEFVKVSFPICLGMLFASRPFGTKLYNEGSLWLLYLLSAGIIIMQPDLGMAILVSITFASIMYLTGLRITWLLVLAIAGLMVVSIAYFMFSHVHYRIDSFFNTSHRSYQLIKATSAIQNGGFFGVGSGAGYYKKYLPDAHTDFIFSVLIEEYGAMVAVLLLSVYLYMFFKMLSYLKRFPKNSLQYVAVGGLAVIFIFQALIHIATNVGVIPTKGATLPFISYGGTSMMASALLIGMVLALVRKQY